MKTTHPILFLVFAHAVSACSAAGEKDTTKDETPVSEPGSVTVSASAETRAELGVESWLAKSDNSSSDVKGYDASRQVVVEFTHDVTSSSSKELHRFVLNRDGATATLEVSTSGSGAAERLQDTFAADASFSRALELIEKDLGAKATGGTSLTTQSFTGAVAPQDALVTGQPIDLIQCGQAILGQLNGDVRAAATCAAGQLLEGLDCAGAINKARLSGDTRANKCQGGVDVHVPIRL